MFDPPNNRKSSEINGLVCSRPHEQALLVTGVR